MLHTEKEYNSAMRQMILRVQQATSVDEINTWDMSIEEAEILLDCVASGYLIGKIPKNITECRTLDGKAHPELFNTVVTPKGLAFFKTSTNRFKSYDSTYCFSYCSLNISSFQCGSNLT